MDSDSGYVDVKCECCRKTHRIQKGDFYTCTSAVNVSGLGGWYILVFSDGEIEQTSHFENIGEKIETLKRIRMERALKT